MADPAPIQANIALRSGTLASRTLANHLNIEFPPNPRPTDPISVTRSQFDAACASLVEGGLDLVEDLDQAWLDFAGWRVNYDVTICRLADFLIAPHDPWTTIGEADLAAATEPLHDA